MPRLTKTNGKELHAFKQEILESIEAKLSQIRDGMDYTASRMDGQARRMDSMAESYAKLERDFSNHLAHIGWGQIGQVALELLGFLAVIAKLTGWF